MNEYPLLWPSLIRDGGDDLLHRTPAVQPLDVAGATGHLTGTVIQAAADLPRPPGSTGLRRQLFFPECGGSWLQAVATLCILLVAAQATR